MARKTSTVVLDASHGRDANKTFIIREMPAAQGEKWAIRALLALTRAGIEVPDDVATMGMAAIATMGLRAFGNLSFDEAEPLLDEMMACVSIAEDPKHPEIARPAESDDIEEVRSYLTLRNEVVALHTGFSIAAEISNYRAAAQADQNPPAP